ncbi:MAG: hypothetical protein PHW02_09350 [bacterium]|nr:hypothetical protein [bacterium]
MKERRKLQVFKKHYRNLQTQNINIVETRQCIFSAEIDNNGIEEFSW